MRALFSPAIRLLNRLSYIGKFMLMGLMCLIAAVVVIHTLYASLNQTIQLSQRQLQGVALIEPMTRTIQAIQQHRGISATLLGGNEAMRDRRAGKEVAIDDTFKTLEAKLPAGLHSGKDFQLISEGWEGLRKDGLQWTVDKIRRAYPPD